MVQFRRRNNAHWYHETQCSGSLEHCSGSPVNISTTVNVPTTVNNENPPVDIRPRDPSESDNMSTGSNITEQSIITEQGIFLLGVTENIAPTLQDTLYHEQPILTASDAMYQALFPTIIEINHTNTFSLYDRLSTALTVAQVTGIQRLCSHYALRLAPLPSPDASRESNIRLTQITQYARQLASQPTLIDRHALAQLHDVGLTDSDIIILSQIIGYVGYQARVVAGISALAGYPTVMLPGFPRMEDAAPSPLPDVMPNWQGWLPSHAANDDQPDKEPDETASTLTELLGHHQQSLLAYHAITTHQPNSPQLQRDWLELVALVSARINGSLYCQARHRQHLQQLTEQPLLVTELLKGIDHALFLLPEQQIPHQLISVTAELTRAPERFNHQYVKRLQTLGVSDTQVMRIIFSIAITGWTNRLRHTLGK
ncbi:CMD domain-containing protein [Yersinia pseudotuberculosis]|uniref:CMD domain-containing protein n=1 Tax=Yersinia pseudotuberculosis TaxID=633 RepID=UPI001A9FDADC|nr:CMD domain-containing protein [Yersinia pseudotuberculosis]MBO1551888.1 CMD domain-containing protein [Yersinia pseudotuberculosis]MBO1572035.1 CMD domain-containing protein [Yersinia pseudotuberculosis]MBO1586939.1 CMD domain-containing protein [Yersinia pseudotuberculosis]MBO1636448.1 CMD domain-containing protein [Yersinia pseudotuberculosis]